MSGSIKTHIHSVHLSAVPSTPPSENHSLGTGYGGSPHRFTGLCLLQEWAVQLLTHRKPQHLPLSGAVASGIVEIGAGFGAGAPLGPLTHLAVFGEEAGSDRHRQLHQRAQTVT